MTIRTDLSTPYPAKPAAPMGDMAIVRRLVRDYIGHQWGKLAIAGLCMIVASSMTGALAWIIDPAIKKIFLEKDVQMLLIIPLEVVGIIALRAVTSYGQDSILNSIAERVIAATQRDMFRSQVRLDIAMLGANHSGELISKFLYDTTLLRNAITRGVAGLGKELVTFIALVAVMLYQDWKLALISVLLLPLVAWVTQILSKSLRKSATRGMEESGVLSKALSESMSGQRIIKAYNLEDHAAKLADARVAERLKYLLRAVRARAAAVPSTDLIGGIAAAATIAYAGYQGIHGDLSINEFSSFVAAMLLAQQPIRTLSQLWTISREGLSAANRIFAIVDARPTIVDRPDARPLEIAPGGGGVTFEDVNFSYHAEAQAASVNAINIDIAPGAKIALVGPSGAGKTTIFNLLLRFYDTVSGTIRIDGTDIRDVTLKSLRTHMALVTQDPILFDESVGENIALGRPGATQDEIIAAARAAAAHDFISALPQGYDTPVGEGGSRLSGGQRQRIAIARAMLRNAPILLLDEATSALDTESERQVQTALAALMKGRTTIVIAHRLSTIIDADKIYVLDKGHIVETGTHTALMARGALYARLYAHTADEQKHAAPLTAEPK
jgi:subfamily B ATP-binding cassette protein MsbA